MPGELGYDTGPFVNVAAFCDQVLEEKTGVLSLIRVVDRLNVQAQGAGAPDSIPEGIVTSTTLVITLRAGEARGSQTLQVTLEQPDGVRFPGPEISINFPGGQGGGTNVVLPVNLNVVSAGLYWADVHLNGRLVTRVPLEITYAFLR